MIACSINHISKMYGGNLIFEDLSFEINEKDRVGLVGPNGCGKTTLMKLIAGMEETDQGKIHWKKGLKIGYLAQIPNYGEKMTARDVMQTAFDELLDVQAEMKQLENEMAAAGEDSLKLEKLLAKYGVLQEKFTLGGGYEMEANIDRIANGLKIEGMLDSNFNSLSGGEKTKVGLGLSLLRNPDLLLLDEPTNHLDIMAAEWLAEFLKEYDGTVVIISHDRYFLDETATKILDLEDGEIDLYHANYSGFIKEKEAELLREFQAFEEQQRKIKKMKEAIKRLRDWANRSNPPSSALHKRATNMERALARMEKLDRPILNRKKMNFELDTGARSGKDVLVFKDVQKSFGGRDLFSKVNLQLHYQDRAAIVGENGSGKTTLLKFVQGELAPDHGEVRNGSNVKIGYLSQHMELSSKDGTVLDAFRNEVVMNEGEARNVLAGFLFYGPDVFKKVSQLSGGERMRLRLAQLMHQDLNFLILDEPTNHLDIDSREVLEEALDGFEGTLLAVSHDRYFLNKLFDKVYWLEGGELTEIDGNYDRARVKMAEKRKRWENAAPAPAEAVKPPVRHEKVMEAVGEIDEEALFEEIESHEKSIGELEQQMAILTDLELLQKLHAEKEALESKRNQLYSKLEEIS
ncbi:ribosomal protection-like ABC-F family protein [Mesobacillus selenatarsenatis]|uniref:ABC transporter ATP-binding protein uup n=1 Tax=Mesobacillus selenatarsenatis (strain DSM 18680 / JCM 14380 / FERM P-15431 / SF-1) TaxID=1321606 RepID=A0A0A8WXV6_MESS1|nr:ABC-F type ribosomal protection protein [Mesobacillus selenatarsenatis]GAM12525.1 ABC transporter ATP-binding protein uup [Mesobacillus selenatarsenatis SF-1]